MAGTLRHRQPKGSANRYAQSKPPRHSSTLPSNGLRLKAGAGYGGRVQNVSYSHITMTNVATPLAITSFYENGSDNFPTDPTAVTAATINSTTPLWKNISFNGITATGASQDGLIYGEPLTGSGAPATNFNGLSLNNVNISGYKGLGACPSNGRDCDGSEMSRMRDGGSSRLLIMSLRDPVRQ